MARDPLAKRKLTPLTNSLSGLPATPATIPSPTEEPVKQMAVGRAVIKKRDRSWEAKNSAVTATYRPIPPELQAEIKNVANENMVRVGEVARLFLEHAMREYKAGRLKLSPQLRASKYTLYPDDSAR